VQGHTGVHADHCQAVADDVVDLPGHLDPLLGAVALAFGLPLGRAFASAGVAGLADDPAPGCRETEPHEGDARVHPQVVDLVQYERLIGGVDHEQGRHDDQDGLERPGEGVEEDRDRREHVDRAFGQSQVEVQVEHGHRAEQRDLRRRAAHGDERGGEPDERERGPARVVVHVGPDGRAGREQPEEEGESDVEHGGGNSPSAGGDWRGHASRLRSGGGVNLGSATYPGLRRWA
jgi:hypothetical protein